MAALLMGPAPCSFHSTKYFLLDAVRFLPSVLLAMRIWSQHMEDEKSRQEQGTVSQILKRGKSNNVQSREGTTVIKNRQKTPSVSEDDRSMVS